MRVSGAVFTGWVTLRLPEIYLAITLLVTGAFCLLKPPFYTADEVGHVYRELELARGELVGRVVDGLAGAETDVNVIELGQRVFDLEQESLRRRLAKIGKPNGQLTEVDLKAMRGERLAHRMEFVPFQNTAIYPLDLYVPGILMWRLGVAQDLPIVRTMLLARLLTALFAAALGWLAMRLAGGERWLVLMVLLLPTILNLAASCSQDALIVPATALAMVLVGRAIATRRLMSGWELAGAALLLALVIDAKPPYLLLAGVLFLPALDGIGAGWRRWMGPAAGVAFVLLVLVHWQVAMHRLGVLACAGCDSKLQMKYLETHPVAGLLTLAKGSLHRGPATMLGGFAIFGLANDVTPPRLFYNVMLLGMAGMVCCSPGLGLMRWRGRFAALAMLVGSSAAITLAEYLVWTPVGATWVDGLQARYWIVLLPLAVLLLRRREGTAGASARARWMPAFAAVFVAAVLLMPWSMARRFYDQPLSVALRYGLK